MSVEEVNDYNSGLRDCILLDKMELALVGEVKGTGVDLGHGVLVCKTEEIAQRFISLAEESDSATYALGICLGYPPKCVEWFEEFSMELRLFIQYKSIVFATSVGLAQYGVDYLVSTYGAIVEEVSVSTHGNREEFSIMDNPYFQYVKTTEETI